MGEGREYVSRSDELGNIHISEEVLAVIAAAAINEAVELARRYDAPEAASFANGILGAFVRGELPPEQADAVDTQAEDKKDGV